MAEECRAHRTGDKAHGVNGESLQGADQRIGSREIQFRKDEPGNLPVEQEIVCLDQHAPPPSRPTIDCADADATGLVGPRYDLAISSFVACHLADLGKLYAETARLTRPSGKVVLVDYHPFMLLKGVPTHFTAPTGVPIAITNVVHLFGDHIAAGCGVGLALLELRDQLVDAEWIQENQRLFGELRLASHLGHPVSFAIAWARA
jgi:hypothetical protein